MYKINSLKSIRSTKLLTILFVFGCLHTKLSAKALIGFPVLAVSISDLTDKFEGVYIIIMSFAFLAGVGYMIKGALSNNSQAGSGGGDIMTGVKIAGAGFIMAVLFNLFGLEDAAIDVENPEFND